jgi:oligosaccharide amylase
MSRHLVIGNGNLLLGLDGNGRVRDLYFDRVGLENHANGRPQRVGVFVDDEMHWLDDAGWDIKITYRDETMVGKIVATHEAIGVRLTINDCVYNESDIYIRKVRIENRTDRQRSIKIYFHNDLEVGGDTFGVTAMYYPRTRSVIHYRGPRVFLFNGRFGGKPICDYSVGMTRYRGLKGTWKDAEDGSLSGNAIEHGRVDSTVAFNCDIGPHASCSGYYWMTAGKTLEEAVALNNDIEDRSPAHLMRTATDFWRAWVNKQNFSFHELTDEQVRLFKTSLLVMRAHTDNHGAIIASSDSDMLQHGKDTYSYMWPRDGAHVAIAFAKAGYWDIAQRFFKFTKDLITNEGYLRHKYLPDGSLGSSWHPWVEHDHDVLPIQEDETAIMLFALWVYYEATRDIEFIEEIYNGFIKKSANFLVNYRHPDTDLPLHSYDLWEEHRTVSTYTASSVYGGLKAAARFSELLGKNDETSEYNDVADRLRKQIFKYLVDKDETRIFKSVRFEKDGEQHVDDRIDASSFFGMTYFGVAKHDDAFTEMCAKDCENNLWNQSPVGGMARYQDDEYYRVHEDHPNPWIITTLWRTTHLIKSAESLEDLKPVQDIFQWVADHALPSGILPEQVHPETGEPLSATPLTWSHSTYVWAVIEYLEKLEELGICKTCEPIDMD